MIETQCFICETDDSEPFLLAKDTLGITDQVFSLSKCRGCGLVFLNPSPDPKEMEAFYPDGYWARRESRIEGYYRDIITHFEIRTLRKFLGKGGRLLDVGSGAGEFLYCAKRLGFDCYGVEVSEDMVKYSIETFGLKNVVNSDLLSASFEDSFFDIIVFNHVVEHLYNPLETLMEARRILKRDGILVIQIQNIDSCQFRAFGKKWLGLSLPQHLYQFTPQTIRFALEKVGFDVFKTLHHSIRNSPIFVSFSLTRLNAYNLYLKEKEGKSVLFQKLLILFLNWTFLPLTLLEGLLKKGGVITVIARKEI
ncbi:MAG TPA: class I SAM-dependent methyltransferase [Candidatus Wunengus sp. YC60]|uniref:class I SAM-dependent methyltransferase n=1 Tax=Candidatus Wunengus sp. YC60 TaxID=3367697 RepID=UPI004024D983